jgi:hypothetical protein
VSRCERCGGIDHTATHENVTLVDSRGAGEAVPSTHAGRSPEVEAVRLRAEVLELFAEAQWLGREFTLVNSPPLERRRRRAEPRRIGKRAEPRRIGRRARPVPYRLTPAAELYLALGAR